MVGSRKQAQSNNEINFRFMPRTYKFISESSKIKYMSARSMFEASLPHDPQGWKK